MTSLPFCKDLTTTTNNVRFNAIILFSWGWQFSLYFALAIFFNRRHPLCSSHIVPNPLHLFPTISLVDLHFPSYFNFSNLTYLRIDVFTHDMTIPPKMVLNYHILDLHNNIHPITKNISWHPINQSYPTRPDHSTLYPMQPCLIQNNKFPCFTTIQ